MSSLRSHFVWLTTAMLWAAAFARTAWPQTPVLTTIQDTLFAADGTRYNGALMITWNTFDANALGTVIQQRKTVAVSNGNLYVQLAPNAAANPPANVYTVLYQSDGNQQYTETWTVPASAAPLRVVQVRIGISTGNSGASTAAGNSTAITEAAVTGLLSDLQQRPVKGPSYAPGAVAVIDTNGQIEAAAGSPGSCVMVDGTTGPCGSGGPKFVDAERPGGTANGANTVFTLQNSPSAGSLMLFRNGMYMLSGFDYTLTGSTIQFTAASVPQTGDTLVASYRLPSTTAASSSGSGSAGGQTLSVPQILCSGAGSSTSSASWTQLASCSVPTANLQAGKRIEIRFTLAHTGSASGFAFEADWGSAAVVSRQAAAQDSAVLVSADAAIGATSSQISSQSWGSALPLLAGMQSIAAQSSVTIALKAMLSSQSSDSIAVSNYVVLLY